MDVCSDQSSTSQQQQQQDESLVRLKRPQKQKQSQQTQLDKQKSSNALICATNSSGGGGELEGAASSELAPNNNTMDSDCSMMIMDDMDEEQLKRILACKRLSEGCNRFVGALTNSSSICRKNSLHMMSESLAPVTEGEPMRHMSHHMSQNIESSASSSSMSSGSFRAGAGGPGGLRHHGGMSKRSSQDDNTNSCSSSTSLDGPRSPTRRRSSTVSQCSSVLSEGARQQLNFDLSPDLAPDSSILEANAISPTDFERPASPEPRSFGSTDGSFEMRPISGMSSQFNDDLMLATSPDSTLGDSNENSNPEQNLDSIEHQRQLELNASNNNNNNHETIGSETSRGVVLDCERHEASIRDNLERIISHVSTVKVSHASSSPSTQLALGINQETAATAAVGGQLVAAVAVAANGSKKRAHTPFGANLQRNKTSLISSSPSPTSCATGPIA